MDCCNGVWRIHGSLAVSRAIGDGYLKQWVVGEPETRILSLNHELEFLILASDGLWDKVLLCSKRGAQFYYCYSNHFHFS